MKRADAASLPRRLFLKWREHGVVGLARRQIDGWKWRVVTNPRWHRLLAWYFSLRGDRIPCRGLTIAVGEPSVNDMARAYIYHGIYERAEIDLASRAIDRSLPLVELGGSIGVVACALNRELQRPERHVVVEANPRLIPLLEENRRINGARFEIVHAAVGYGASAIRFALGDSLSGAIRDGGDETVEVATISLAKLLRDRGFQRVNLVMDVEGMEVALVENELDVLANNVQHVVMEGHERFVGGDAIARMYERLEAAGFVQVERDRGEVVSLVNRRLAPAPAESTA